jgi:hypothetical protein
MDSGLRRLPAASRRRRAEPTPWRTALAERSLQRLVSRQATAALPDTAEAFDRGLCLLEVGEQADFGLPAARQ